MSCCYLLKERNNSNEYHSQSIPCLLSAIQELDRAIVFAGAPERLDLIHDLIETLRHQLIIPKSAVYGCLLESATSDRQQCGPTSMPVPRVHIQNLLFSDFTTPFIIPGAISDWPAISDPDHAWNSIDYLLSVAGPGRIIPVEIGNDYRVDNWSQKMMPWEVFLCSLRTSDAIQKDEKVYLAQHSLLTQFPKLRDDILIPDLVYIVPETREAGHKPPSNEDRLIINAWLGPKGTISPAHKVSPHLYSSSIIQQFSSHRTRTSIVTVSRRHLVMDTSSSFLVAQVVGSKSVWLAPPKFADEMYPLPSALGLANTTSVDVFQPDASQHPLFLQEVVPKAMVITLQPGDLLFFPPGWWHSMRSESTSFSISFWF